MKHTTNKSTIGEFGGMISFDTTFVLFFLAMEYGRSTQMFSIDAVLMGITTLMVLALPYFLVADRALRRPPSPPNNQ